MNGTYNYSFDSFLKNSSIPFYFLFLELPTSLLTDAWFPCGIGLIYLFVIIYYFSDIRGNRKRNNNDFIFVCFFISIIGLLFSSNIVPWNNKILQFLFVNIQFPWRIFSVVICFLIIGSSLYIFYNNLLKKHLIKIGLLLSCTLFLFNLFFSMFSVKLKLNYDNSIMDANYLPVDMNRSNLSGNIKINNDVSYSYANNILTIINNNYDDTIVEVPLTYYLGYETNNKNIDVFKTDDGTVGLNIGVVRSGDIRVYYRGTIIYRLSRLISLFSIIVIFLIFVKKNLKKRVKF